MIRLKHISLPPAERLALLLRAHKIRFEREYEFAAVLGRKWRADFVLPSKAHPKILLEVEGLVWQGAGGRHQRPRGFTADIRKYEAARALGLQVVRVVPSTIDTAECLPWILNALARTEGR